MEESSESLEGLEFKLHDFGARSVSSYESSGIGGAAHLVNFMGTDTMAALQTVMRYYNMKGVPGFSIPAAEHSTMSPWGRGQGEVEAYRNMIQQYGGKYPLMAVVSDTWDVFNAAENIWGDELRQEVMDSGTMLVVRPDSGDPATVVLKLLEILGRKFGYEINTKGYKVLNNVRVIQGDGINVDSIPQIIETFMSEAWSMDNVTFGMGGGLLQMNNRDTLKFAYKCSAICIDGEWKDVYKDPVTDAGKRSKRGRLELFKFDGQYVTVAEKDYDAKTPGDRLLETVFLDGEVVKELTFEEVRENASV
jgi:nicotinamide phosphoribosyltransferase